MVEFPPDCIWLDGSFGMNLLIIVLAFRYRRQSEISVYSNCFTEARRYRMTGNSIAVGARECISRYGNRNPTWNENMAIICTNCNASLKGGNAQPGTKAKCPSCGQVISIPPTEFVSSERAPAQKPAALGLAPPGDAPPLLDDGNETSRRGTLAPVLLVVGACVLLVLVAGGGMLALALLPTQSPRVENNNVPSTKQDSRSEQDPFKDNPEANSDKQAPETNKLPGSDPVISPPPPNKAGRLGNVFTVEFMGSQGQGSRFCIIADSSKSMNRGILVGGKKKSKKKRRRITALDYLKNELLKTIRGLDKGAHFSVILFDAKAIPMPGGDWRRGGTKDVDELVPWIKNMETHLKTLPYPAFVRAFKLKPRPDVIFFMTDGQYRPDVWKKVIDLNQKQPRVVINTIQLHAGGPRKAKAKGKKKFGNLAQTLKRLYGKGKLPKEVQEVFAEAKKNLPPKSDSRTVYQEFQMRMIASHSRGSFRKIVVSSDGK